MSEPFPFTQIIWGFEQMSWDRHIVFLYILDLYIYINKRKGSNADSKEDKDEVARCISYFLVYIEGFLLK